MDYLNNFGPCKKCGQGGFSFPKIDYQSLTFRNKIKKDNYCSDCGQRLTKTCSACNGSGKKNNYNFFNRDRERYCSECGRELEYSDKCASCDGTGEIYDSNHWLSCSRRFF